MPMPDFLRAIRDRYGSGYVLLPAVAAVVRDHDERILVMRRADTGEWSLPSGICEPDEAPARTAMRELFEETGLHCVPERLLAVFATPPIDYPNGDRAGYVSTLFAMRCVGGALACRDGEALELRFVPRDALPAMRVVDWLPAPLDALLAASAADSATSFRWDPRWLEELH